MTEPVFDNKKQSWSIIILCYNEEDSIGQVTDNALHILKEISNGDFEIILVNDGSTDGSEENISQLKKTYPVHIRVITHPENRGIGQGLRSGYFAASKENVVFIPGDAQYNVTELIPYATFGDDRFICFYRVENTHYSLFRNGLSLFNKICNALFLDLRLKDINWVKIYKRKYLHLLNLKTTSSLIESEICAKLISIGMKPVEAESKYLKRAHGKSKGASIKIMLAALSDLFKLLIVVNYFKFFAAGKVKKILAKN